jgi:hypothetical protein
LAASFKKELEMKARKPLLYILTTILLTFILSAGAVQPGASRNPSPGDGLIVSGMLPSTITYQGRLTDASGNPLNGTYNLTFQVWNDATAGLQLGTNIVLTGVLVKDGLFTVKLNVPHDAFDGQSIWLQVAVNGQILSPRQMLTAVPYALSLKPGASITSTGIDTIHFGNQAGGYAVEAWSRNNIAIVGSSGVTDGTPPKGLHGVHGTGAGVGVYGVGGHTGTYGTGDNDGVLGESTNGKGVRGTSTNSAGVKGESTNANGVVGWTGRSGPGEWSGVYGHSTGGVGVTGRSDTYNGIKAVTKSNEHAALAAGNEGGGPAIYAQGGTDGLAAIFAGNLQVRSLSTGATLVELGEGLDYAEGFNLSEGKDLPPGTVVVIDADDPGKLTLSNQPYDKKVAGVIAGAQGLGSGVQLGVDGNSTQVALAGQVYCNVDGIYGDVAPGDLLTTSPTPGYAMVVKDSAQGQGAILGKAMQGLAAGEQGQILILVTLQ